MEAGRRLDFWGVLGWQGGLPGGGGFRGLALGCFAQRPVEASWGRRAWDTGAGTWGAVVLLMGGRERGTPDDSRGLGDEVDAATLSELW